MGGLSRRATIIDNLSGTHLTVDAGNFAWKSGRLEEARLPQQRRKAQLQLDAFALSGIDGVAPGVGDLVLGVDWLKAEAAQREVPLLATNLSCGGQAPFDGWRTIERDGISIGLVGVLSDKRKVEGCQVSDPVIAMKEAAAALPDVDLLIAMTHNSDDEDIALAEAVPEIDLIINGHARLNRPSPSALPGNALQLSSGSRGKKLGLAEITLIPGASGFSNAAALKELERKKNRAEDRLQSARENLASPPDDGAKRRAERQIAYYTEELAGIEAELSQVSALADVPTHEMRNRLAPLDRKVSDHEGVTALLTAALADIEALEATAQAPALVDTPFLGSETCAGCHPTQHAQWQTTAHARAWQSLVEDKRTADRDCISCHVTGGTDPRGPTEPAQVTASLQGVGCEDCHGPGREHLKEPGAHMVADPGEAVCVTCHDGVQDEGRFDFETYRPKIVHGEQ